MYKQERMRRVFPEEIAGSSPASSISASLISKIERQALQLPEDKNPSPGFEPGSLGACDHNAYFQILRWFFTQYPWKEVVLDQSLAEELRHVYERSGAKGFSLTKCFARVEELRAVCDHSAISKYSGGFSPYIY